jgi:hypothetical protein
MIRSVFSFQAFTSTQGQDPLDDIDIADRSDESFESDVKRKSWKRVDTETVWGSARREPNSWWGAARFLMARNFQAFCELSCATALIAVGVARYRRFSPSTELMIAAATRCSAVDATPMF